MGTEWQSLTVGDVCYVTDGAHSKVERVTSGRMYLTSKNIGYGELKLDSFDYIKKSDFERLFTDTKKAQRKLRPDDVLIGIIGTFGNTYIYKKEDTFGISSSIAILRANPELILPEFLYYTVSSKYFRSIVEKYKGGSAQGYTNIATIKSFPVYAPSLHTQRKIVEQLKPLDNKISLNHQTYQTLEKMIQALFKSWILDFDPVIDNALDLGNAIPKSLETKANARQAVRAGDNFRPLPKNLRKIFPSSFEESEIGWIPKNWEIKRLKKITTKISKGTTPREIDMLVASGTKTVPFLKVQNLTKDGGILQKNLSKIPASISSELLKRSILKANDILISIAGTIGRVAVLDSSLDGSNCNQAIAFIRLPDAYDARDFIRLTLQSKRVQASIHSKIVQGVQANLSLTELGNVKLLLPSENILDEFNNAITPIVTKQNLLVAKNKHLTKLRDTLIPKLISGEIEISEESIT